MALYLTEQDVGRLADIHLALDAVESAHRALALGEAMDIPRQRVRTGSAMQHVLQAGWPARGVMGYKAYTSSAQGARFWLHLFDSSTGEPLAVIEADRLGMLRTGAASGVAARYLARQDARRVALIGAGWQARSQVLAMAAVREVTSFKVFARRSDKLEAFCAEMAAETGVPMEPADSAEAAVEGADIVITATTSPKPVLEGAWLAPGMHVSAVGSNSLVRRELDEAAVRRAEVVCADSRASAFAESGDLLPLIEKGRLLPGAVVELGEVVAGFRPGRTGNEQVTLFESQGMALQDIALGAAILQRASAAGVGVALPY
ncbi:MAG: ornithine cyclodeaminase family protein [Moraxellaceae bacterium]|nr:ornithine cyclodeaminase family protein [Moraxellaceae bacterium]